MPSGHGSLLLGQDALRQPRGVKCEALDCTRVSLGGDLQRACQRFARRTGYRTARPHATRPASTTTAPSGCDEPHPTSRLPPLRGDATADVAIIGGGFTGVSTAWHLSRRFPERRIVLLEARALGQRRQRAQRRPGAQLDQRRRRRRSRARAPHLRGDPQRHRPRSSDLARRAALDAASRATAASRCRHRRAARRRSRGAASTRGARAGDCRSRSCRGVGAACTARTARVLDPHARRASTAPRCSAACARVLRRRGVAIYEDTPVMRHRRGRDDRAHDAARHGARRRRGARDERLHAARSATSATASCRCTRTSSPPGRCRQTLLDGARLGRAPPASPTTSTASPTAAAPRRPAACSAAAATPPTPTLRRRAGLRRAAGRARSTRFAAIERRLRGYFPGARRRADRAPLDRAARHHLRSRLHDGRRAARTATSTTRSATAVTASPSAKLAGARPVRPLQRRPRPRGATCPSTRSACPRSRRSRCAGSAIRRTPD